MKKIMFLCLITMLLILVPLISYADVIYMNDGEEIEGEITEVTGDSITIKTRTSEINLLIHNISKIVYQETIDEITTEYAQKREDIKSELEALGENNGDITIVINDSENVEEDTVENNGDDDKKEEDIINVTYDEYMMEYENHRVGGINLKDYYNLDQAPAYKDKIVIGNYERIRCEIIDVDKLIIKAKTETDIIVYEWKDISGVYFDIANSNETEYPENRKVIREMLNFYNKNYDYIFSVEFKRSNNINSKFLFDIGAKFSGIVSNVDGKTMVSVGLSFGGKLLENKPLFLKGGYDFFFIDVLSEFKLEKYFHGFNLGLEYIFSSTKIEYPQSSYSLFMNFTLGLDYNLILGDRFSNGITFYMSFLFNVFNISLGFKSEIIGSRFYFGIIMDAKLKFYI